MDSARLFARSNKLVAYILPMAFLAASLALVSPLKKFGGAFWLAAPEYWIFPVQTFCCAAILLWYRRVYHFGRIAQPIFTVALAILVFVLWVSPQQFFGFAPRLEGFNPDTFAGQPIAYWSTVVLRFIRLVVVVPFVEEIFWRGFLLRYFINEDFDRVPFGTFSWLSFGVVTGAFMLVHSPPDWPAAAITGALYNFVAYRTKSLSSCILAHAITNLLLGFWIMQTRQYGFW